MSQNDFNIANQGFAAFRGDLNGALQALATNSSGSTGPSTTYAYQWWYDTTANILKIRNDANSAWIDFAYFDQGTGTWGISGDLTIADKIVHSGDTNTAIRFPADDTVTVETSGSERLRVDSSGNVGIGTSPSQQLHITGNFRIGSAVLATPSGDAPIYVCRAWVNFNGTGTVAIRASGNVSSITDNGTGDYTVNFATAMPDVNYSVNVTSGNPASGTGSGGAVLGQTQEHAGYTVNKCDIATRNVTSGGSQAVIDAEIVNVAIFR